MSESKEYLEALRQQDEKVLRLILEVNGLKEKGGDLEREKICLQIAAVRSKALGKLKASDNSSNEVIQERINEIDAEIENLRQQYGNLVSVLLSIDRKRIFLDGLDVNDVDLLAQESAANTDQERPTSQTWLN